MNSIDEFLALFPKPKVVKLNHWMVRCPSHNDGERPDHYSLSVKGLPDKILLNCMAGCPTVAVVKSLHLEMKDLFLNNREQSTTLRDPKEIDITYDYHDADGKVIFQVVKFKPKSFAQRRPGDAGDWVWNLRGVKPVLYHLLQVKEAISKGSIIFLPEGEKDADNLIKLGVDATTSPMGAGKWKESYSKMLAGAKLVVVISDNDEPGQRHANFIATSLYKTGTPVKLLEMPERSIKDVTDWIAKGLALDTLKGIIDGLPPYVPPASPENDSSSGKYHRTDLGNAERLIAQHGETTRYCYQRKQWLMWNGKHWEWDHGATIISLAQKTVRTIYNEVANEDNSDERRALVAHARSSESNSRIKAMIEQAQPMVAVDIKELDNHPWKLNCLNGTIDLKTGDLAPHNKEDFITMACPVEYSPSAQSALWDSFLSKICEEKADVITYLQRCMGYTLTGDTQEQCLFFCWGTGMNGKSTFLNAFREILSSYSIQADTDMFMVAFKPQKQGHSEDVANLLGKRYVVGSEIEEGRHLAVTKLKQMTGGERVRASHKFEREIEFDVTYKIWLNGNHKPEITDTTYSIWRRVKLIPFNVRIPNEEQDKQLGSKLRGEFPSLLAWAVRGCLDWQQHGLAEPDSVTAATELYRHEQDIIGDFIEDWCFIDSAVSVGKKELWESYQGWTSDSGVHPVGQRTFNRRIGERGIVDRRGTGGKRLWLGIRLLSTDEEKQVTQVTQVTRNTLFSHIEETNNKNIEKPVTKVTLVTDISGMPRRVTGEDDLSPGELKAMLEEYTGLTLLGVTSIWKGEGSPVLTVGQGAVISNLELYLERGIVNMEHLGVITEWIKEVRGEKGK